MSVRDGALRLRILAGATLLVVAAVPAVARAQAAAGAKPAQAQQPAAATQKAVPGQTGTPGTPAAQKAAAPQKPVAQAPATQKSAPKAGVAAQKPAPVAGQPSRPAAGKALAAQPQQPAAAKGQKPAPRPRVRRAVVSEAERAAMAAKPPEPPEPVKDTVVVKEGDTLWDLSTKYLGSPWIWPRVYNANRGGVKHPHWIYPGQKLAIPGAAEIAAALAEQEQPAVVEAPPPDTAAKVEETAPARRPAVTRLEYLATPWIEPALVSVGRMLDRVKVEGNAEKLAQAAILHDRVYIRPAPGTTVPATGNELLLVRADRRLAPYGVVVEPTALVRVEGGNADVAVARIVQQFGPVLQGDRALPVPMFTPPAAVPPQPVQRGPEGQLFAFVREQPLHTVADLAFVNMGKAEGLQVGDVLLAFAPTRPAAADPTVRVPPEDVARLLVVKVSEHTATVRPLSVSLPSLQRGLMVRLVARVP